MPAARRAPRALTAAVAPCALSLASATPGLARPGGHGPARACIGCGGHPDPRLAGGVQSSSLAGTVEAPDGGGTTTLAIVLIAGGALLAGGGAGFAGGRRVAVRAG